MKNKPIYKICILMIWWLGLAAWLGCGEGDDATTKDDEDPIAVAPTGGLSGQVESIDGVEITVKILQNGREVAAVKADANGVYQVNNLKTGVYTVRISAKGYETVEQSVQIVADQTTSLDKATLNAIEAPVAHLRGVLLDEATKTALGNARVRLVDVRGNVLETVTSAAGAFAFENLPADQPFTLMVEHEGYEKQRTEIDPLAADEIAKIEVELKPVDREELPLGDGLSIGTKAPDFSLPDENGMIRSLADYAGKKLVLVFDRGRW
jgi:hypothetical protein